MSSPSRRVRLEEGMKVEADYRGRGKYFPGKIRRDRGDGTFDIDYDDGESELRVREELIRPIGGASDTRSYNNYSKSNFDLSVSTKHIDSLYSSISNVSFFSSFDDFLFMKKSFRSFFNSSSKSFGSLSFDLVDDINWTLLHTQMSSFFKIFNFSPSTSFINRIFYCFDSLSQDSIKFDDLLLYLYEISLSKSSFSLNLYEITLLLHSRQKPINFLYSFLKKMDTTSPGFLPTSELSKFFSLNFGSLLSSDHIYFLKEYFDPNTTGFIDIFFICGFLDLIYHPERSFNRFKKCVQLLLEDKIELNGKLIEHAYKINGKRVLDIEKFIEIISSFEIPILPFELVMITQKYTKKKKVYIDAFINSLSKIIKKPNDSENNLSSVSSSNSSSSTSTSVDFGHDLYRKLCKIRYDSDLRNKVRLLLFKQDPNFTGMLSSLLFFEVLDISFNFTVEEKNLLAENFLSNSIHKDRIFYLDLLLILIEPLKYSVDLVSNLIDVISKYEEPLHWKSTILKVLSLCSHKDVEKNGLITQENILEVIEGSNLKLDKSLISQLLLTFFNAEIKGVYYPEFLTFLYYCSKDVIVQKFDYFSNIRSQQGYSIFEILRNSPESNFVSQLISLGIFLPKTSIDILYNYLSYNNFSKLHQNIKNNKSFNLNSSQDYTPKVLSSIQNVSISSLNASIDNIPKQCDTPIIPNLTKFDPTSSTKEIIEKKKKNKCKVAEELLLNYDNKLIKALKIAFDLFDRRGKNEIKSTDLERVMCSIGYFLSLEEIVDLIDKIDPKQTSTLNHNAFMETVIPFIREKYRNVMTNSIEKLKSMYFKFDSNKDGILQKEELKHFLVLSSNLFTHEELDAFIKYLDKNNDGEISWNEFVSVLESINQEEELTELSLPLQYAIRKIQFCSLPDPEEYLTIFVGLPSNYRLSILSEVDKTSNDNSLHDLVCNSSFQSLEKNSKSTTVQFEIQISGISGVPIEEISRIDDVIGRSVKFCVVQTDTPPSLSCPGNPPIFLSNVTTLHAHLHDNHADKWVLSDYNHQDPDKSCFVKCTAKDTYNIAISQNLKIKNGQAKHNEQPINQLYLFVELISTFKVNRNFKVTKQGLKILKTKKKFIETENDKTDKISTQVRTYTTVDICCGWAMIPIKEYLLQNQNRPFSINMFGGTPFGVISIREDEITKRPGAWQAIKRIFGYKVKSILDISIKPIGMDLEHLKPLVDKSLPFENQPILCLLPTNIIIPKSSISIVAVYRKLLLDSLNVVDIQFDRLLPQSTSHHHADVILSAFPKLLSNRITTTILLLLWKREFYIDIEGRSSYELIVADSTNVKSLKIFRDIVLQLWHTYYNDEVNYKYSFDLETYDEEKKRFFNLLKKFPILLTEPPKNSFFNTAKLRHSISKAFGSKPPRKEYQGTMIGGMVVTQDSEINSPSLLANDIVTTEIDATKKTISHRDSNESELDSLQSPFNTKELRWTGRVLKLN